MCAVITRSLSLDAAPISIARLPVERMRASSESDNPNSTARLRMTSPTAPGNCAPLFGAGAASSRVKYAKLASAGITWIVLKSLDERERSFGQCHDYIFYNNPLARARRKQVILCGDGATFLAPFRRVTRRAAVTAREGTSRRRHRYQGSVSPARLAICRSCGCNQ